MDQRGPTYLALTLATLCWVLLFTGWVWSYDPAWRPVRAIAFALGGMASLPTLVLCIYYLRIRRLRSVGISVATFLSVTYALPFLLFAAGTITHQPFAARLAAYAF